MQPFFQDYYERLQIMDGEFIKTFADLPTEALDWVPGADMNSFCVLVVHVAGSTRYWIGDAALGDPSGRVRAEEFQARGLTHDELKERFAALEDYVRNALERLTLADLAAKHTIFRDGKDTEITASWALLHAITHLSVHLGHAQITRQLWERRASK
jgi:uncharacterized damage-inducible protein DinB